MSMPYAPAGSSWDHSLIGDRLSCIAVCEMIDDASVKCQTKGIILPSVLTNLYVVTVFNSVNRLFVYC